ncbi:MAG: hypothetical protein H0V70_10150 [Ktedonobacteraceae bacterium]|nr:hypothetical protein [Ktedonobacteraceae bacterium]
MDLVVRTFTAFSLESVFKSSQDILAVFDALGKTKQDRKKNRVVAWNVLSRGEKVALLCQPIGSPEIKELSSAQGGNERTGQLCYGSRLPQFSPVVAPAPVAHPLRAEPPPHRVEEGEAQHRRIVGIMVLLGLHPRSQIWVQPESHLERACQNVKVEADVLVDLDVAVLDSDAILTGLGMLLHCCHDFSQLLWQDQ